MSSLPVRPGDDWTAYSGRINLSAGSSPLYFAFEGGNSLDFSAFEID